MKRAISRLLTHVRRYRFRYDVFLSYARKDGTDYARQLRDRLKELDFTAFLDETEMTPGDPLHQSLHGALDGSATLVIVGTPAAAYSEYIAVEVERFAMTGRRIIPINIGGSITEPPWEQVRNADPIWIDDTADALAHGAPSLSVATDVERFFDYRKRNSIRRIQAIGIALLFAVITIVSGVVIAKQVEEFRDERGKRELATALANRARGRLVIKEKEVEDQTRIAAQYLRTADQRLIESTQEQGRYELLRGNRQQALISLAEVYRLRPNDTIVRMLVASAARGVVHEVAQAAAPITSASWSHDDRRILTVSRETANAPAHVDLWHRNGRHIARLQHPESVVRKAAFAGRRIVTANERGMSIWSEDGRRLYDLAAVAEVKVEQFLVLHDSTRLLAASKITTVDRMPPVFLIDIETGHVVRELPPDESTLFMNADGETAGTINGNGVVRLFRTSDGADVATLNDRNYQVAALSPDGSEIALGPRPPFLCNGACPNDHEVFVRNLKTGEEEGVRISLYLPAILFNLDFDADGSRVAIRTGVFSSVVWERDQDAWADGVRPEVLGTPPLIAPDGQRVATCSGDRAGIYDAVTRENLEEFPHWELLGCQFSTDGKTLLTFARDGVRLWDTTADGRIATTPMLTKREASALSQNGRWLLTLSSEAASVIDTLTGEARSIDYFGYDGSSVAIDDSGRHAIVADSVDTWLVDFSASAPLVKTEWRCHRVAISSDGAWLACGSATNTADTGVVFRRWDGTGAHTINGQVHDVRFMQGGSLALIILEGETVIVHDPRSRKNLLRVHGCNGAISPDGNSAAIFECADEDGHFSTAPLRLVSLKKRAERPLSGTGTFEHLFNRGQAVFSNDGRMLATSSMTGPVRLWSVTDAQLLHTLMSSRFSSNDPTYGVEGLAFDESGERLVAVEQSGIRVWDVRRGVPIAFLGGSYSFTPETLRFLPGGNFVVGFSPASESTSPGALRLWTTALEKRSPGQIEQLVAMISPDVRAGVGVSLRAKLQHNHR